MNKADRIRYEKLVELGCIVSVDGVRCESPCEVHHCNIRAMGMRAPNHLTVGLCAPHHRTGGYGVAVHAGLKEWQKRYGTEAELLALTNELIGE